ncbi:MAG: RecB-like helicase [Helicobacteraceae bacterium]|jgi:ATP-dependent exoDNAse (exonuclease V) beta subunit|nr:RecB-like helicase [Helicobacteraceae bacterium]
MRVSNFVRTEVMGGFEPYLACEASAGSGKTYQLSLRYAALLFMGARPEKILCLTFTRKSANEMQQRIQKLLKNHGDEMETLALWLGVSADDLRKEASGVYRRFLRSHTQIMTIDAFFNRILRQFALYCGLSPRFEIRGERDLVEKMLRGMDTDNLARLAFECDKNAEQIFSIFSLFFDLGIAFNSSKSAGFREVMRAKEEAEAIFTELADLIRSSPLASEYALKALSGNTLEGALKSTWIEKERLSDYRYFAKITTPQMDALFLRLKEALRRYFLLRESNALDLFARAYGQFEAELTALLKRSGALSFAQVTHFVYKLLSGAIDGDFFYFRLDGRIEHLLIDEFQDTSLTQFSILCPIVEEFTAGEGAARLKSFFYVGDQKQSIYRFRGGNPHLFEFVRNRYANIKVQTLETNYRSLAEPVNFVNRVFESRFDGFTAQKPHREARGYVRVSSADDPVEDVVDFVRELLARGAAPNDIAVLVWRNNDVETVASAIREEIKDAEVETETTRLIVSTPSVKAVIEAAKYLYCEEKSLYAANLLALTAIDPSVLNDLPVTLAPLDLCYEIANRLHLFESGGSDLLKFLEWTSEICAIEELICAETEERAVKGAQEGICVMTVHKSKGLEFTHTIVCDKLGRAGGGGENLILDYDGVALKKIYWRESRREFADREYGEALERQKRERSLDDLNALYVAFTRAKDSLFIAQKSKGSFFEPLSLTVGEHGEFPTGAAKRPAFAPPLIKTRPREIGAQEKPPAVKTQSSAAANFGLAFHFTLETMEAFDEKSLAIAIAGARNRFGLQAPVDEVKERIESLLRCGEFISLVSNARTSKEATVVYKGEIKRLDLLLETGEGYVVIDYKTGGRHSAHILQVKQYCAAIEAITKKKTTGYIVYVSGEAALVKAAG